MNYNFHNCLLKFKYNTKIYLNVFKVNLILPKKDPPPLALSLILLLLAFLWKLLNSYIIF